MCICAVILAAFSSTDKPATCKARIFIFKSCHDIASRPSTRRAAVGRGKGTTAASRVSGNGSSLLWSVSHIGCLLSAATNVPPAPFVDPMSDLYRQIDPFGPALLSLFSLTAGLRYQAAFHKHLDEWFKINLMKSLLALHYKKKGGGDTILLPGISDLWSQEKHMGCLLQENSVMMWWHQRS